METPEHYDPLDRQFTDGEVFADSDCPPPEIGRTWWEYVRQLGLGAGSMFVFVLVIAVGYRCYDYVSKDLRDRRFYRELNSILVQLQDARNAPSPDFARIRETGQRIGAPIASALAGTNFEFPARQKLLFGARDELPLFMYGDLATVSNAEVAFIEHLTEAASLLNLSPPSIPIVPETIAALSRIEQLGGVVMRDPSQGIQPVTAIVMKGDQFLDEHLDHLPNISSVDIESAEVTDLGLQTLSRLSSLKTCRLKCAKVTDAGIKHLKVLPLLTEVELIDCSDVTDSGLIALKRIPRLCLYGSQITDRTLTVLKDFRKLQHLSLRSDSLTDEGISALKGLPQLNSLVLTHCHNLTDAALVEVAEIQNLRIFWIEGADITDIGLESIGKLSRLGNLVITSCRNTLPGGLRITDNGLVFLKNLQFLYSVSIEGCPEITDASIELLKTLKSVRQLELKKTGVTEEGYQLLVSSLPNVRIEFALPEQSLSRIKLTPEVSDAVKQFRERGGTIDHLGADFWYAQVSGSKSPDFTAEDFKLLRPIEYLEGLTLEDLTMTDAALAALSEAVSIESLHLMRCQMTATGIGSLAQFTDLIDLELSETPLDEAAANRLQALPVETLTIKSCGLQDAGMRAIGMLADLSQLSLQEPFVTAAGWEFLGSSTYLETLTIDRMPISELAAKRIAEIPNLLTADFQNCEIAPEGFASLAIARRLKYIEVSGSSVTDLALQQLQSLPHLVRLSLSSDQITDAGVAHLSESPTLSELIVQDAPITDQVLQKLKTLPRLKILMLLNTQITDAGAAEFQKDCPDVIVTRIGNLKTVE